VALGAQPVHFARVPQRLSAGMARGELGIELHRFGLRSWHAASVDSSTAAQRDEFGREIIGRQV
jgi:hypothetical protein